MGTISDIERQMYYGAALAGLLHVEGRRPTGRRFCEQADARWGQLQGDLTTADRIDLLIRDANAQWPSAFGARAVFDLRAVAEDEPFGTEWRPLDPVDAEEMWRSKARPTETASQISAAIDGILQAWERSREPFEVGIVNPEGQFVVAGTGAIAALIEAFATGTDLDWADQVICVASDPCARQLAALAGALLNTIRATQLYAGRPNQPEQEAELKDQLANRRQLVSPDALSQDATAIQGTGA